MKRQLCHMLSSSFLLVLVMLLLVTGSSVSAGTLSRDDQVVDPSRRVQLVLGPDDHLLARGPDDLTLGPDDLLFLPEDQLQRLVVLDPATLTLTDDDDGVSVEVDLDSPDLKEEEHHQEDTQGHNTDQGHDTHQRSRRQTTVGSDIQVQNSRGGRRISGSVNLDHTWDNKHTVSGNIGLDHTKIPGLPSQRDYSAGVGYTFNPNKRTSLNLGVTKNWGDSGSSHTFGGRITHTFGRKKRSAGRVKVKCRSNGRHKVKVRGNVSAEVIEAAIAACNKN
ncbi:hypothetical protein Pcinc_033400 [Petrolisthes cinctipes]|uniref:Uncharacterized protein n=1 Tax=Petrolisthes cinctipes TaxID=88211 RepID=A0AAE1ESJ1_PETCI|nr:hypothetical protein Pcinc_033400 [Petrolisthes cinctipes]